MIGGATVESNAAIYETSRLALDPEEASSTKVDDEVEWVTITEGHQNAKASLHKGIENRGLTGVALCGSVHTADNK